jgi:hypothetical protein
MDGAKLSSNSSLRTAFQKRANCSIRWRREKSLIRRPGSYFGGRRPISAVMPKHNFIAWCRKVRGDLKSQLDAFESGSFRLREKVGRKWVDITGQALERTKARLAEIDGLLKDVSPNPIASQDEVWSRVLKTFPGVGSKIRKPPADSETKEPPTANRNEIRDRGYKRQLGSSE